VLLTAPFQEITLGDHSSRSIDPQPWGLLGTTTTKTFHSSDHLSAAEWFETRTLIDVVLALSVPMVVSWWAFSMRVPNLDEANGRNGHRTVERG
jgi:hypothetical protein